MTLKEQIDADLKTALLGGDKLTAETLRGLKSAILYEEVAQKVRESGLNDDQIMNLLKKEVKRRDESAALYDQGGSQERADKERAEKVIIEKYLPAQMDESQIRAIVDEVVASIPDATMQQMGQVIGAVKAKAGAQADGAVIARLVKEKLQGA